MDAFSDDLDQADSLLMSSQRAEATKELARSMFYDDPNSFVDHCGLSQWLERYDEVLYTRWLRLKSGFLDECAWYPVGFVEYGLTSAEFGVDHRVATMYTDLDITIRGSVLDVIAFMTSMATQIRFEANRVTIDRRGHRMMNESFHRCCVLVGHSLVTIPSGASRFDGQPVFVDSDADIESVYPQFYSDFVQIENAHQIRGMLPDFIVDALLA